MADQRIKDMRLPLFALLLSERLATHGSVTASITVPIPRIIAMVSAAFAKNCGNVVFEFVGMKNVSRYVVIIPLMSPLAKSPRHRAKILPFVIFFIVYSSRRLRLFREFFAKSFRERFAVSIYNCSTF